MVDVQQEIQFFHDLFDGLPDGRVFLRFMDNARHGYTIPLDLDNINEISWNKILLTHGKEGYNAYFTPTVFTKDANSYTKQYVYATKTFRVDIDIKDEVVLKRLKESELPPTAIVMTGGGYHAYWLLAEPFYFSYEQYITMYEDITAALLTKFNGDMQTKNVNRLMRIPGSCNYKYTPPVLVQIVEYNDVKYDIMDFVKLAHKATDIVVTPSNDDWKRQIIELVKPIYSVGQRHSIALYLSGLLRKRHISYDDALDVITQLAHETQDEEVKDRQLAVAYTYQRDLDGIKGYFGLREIDADVAKAVVEILKSNDDIANDEDLAEELYTDIINQKLTVLGKTTDGKDIVIHVYHNEWHKSFTISLGKSTALLLENILGIPLDVKSAKVVRSILNQIALSKPYVDYSETYGHGIWKIKDNFYVANLGMPKVLVDMKNKRLSITDKPIIEGKLFVSEEWVPMEYVEYVVNEDNWDTNTLFDYEVYKHWYTVNWEQEWMGKFLHAILTIGFIANHLDIRPFVYILGYSGSGKTWLFEKMKEVTQNVVRLENTTFASRMVQLNNNMVFPLFNDFEPTEYNMKIIEEWKQATLGNAIITRSTANHNIKIFTLFHIPIFNSVNLTVTDEAIINRIILLKLLPLTPDLPRYEDIDREATWRWIVKSMLIGVVALPRWRKNGKIFIAQRNYKNLDTRMKNALAPIIGLMIEAGLEEDVEKILEYYNDYFSTMTSVDTNVMSEHALEMIVDATIQHGREIYNASELVALALEGNEDAVRLLSRFGIIVVDGHVYLQLYKAFHALKLKGILPNPSALRSLLKAWNAKQLNFVKLNKVVYRKVYDITEVFKKYLGDGEGSW